ncbi:MAG: glyoxylate/hydroxypyruvate reductase A [Alphaproteobacteria bacterium]|nr:glyoxylate/hydroxypyruvate reductase A [Alphaproteobacteria bacterium]
MILALKTGRLPASHWLEAFAAKMPELEVRVWPECGDRAEVDVLFTTRIPEGEVRTFPNLKFVALVAAGADRFLADPDIPEHLPIVRAFNPEQPLTMKAWIAYQVIRHHREMPQYEADQRAHRWDRRAVTPPREVRIGIMGLGQLGGAAARTLVDLGYDVAGWTRTGRGIEGVEDFIGGDALKPFLARSDILIGVLPFTKATDGLLDADAFAALPRGAFIINSGRGELIVEDDLIAALDQGHLSGAALDVFRTEPLPPDHPFWDHPKIAVTPHNSSTSSAWHAVDIVIENIRRLEAGEPLVATIDRDAGY